MAEPGAASASWDTLLDGLPDAALVPVGWLREQLRAEPAADSADAQSGDLTVQAVAQDLGRAASTIRYWCRAGLLEGAYRLRGREWRIPPAALQRFLNGQAVRSKDAPTDTAAAVRIDGWRQARRGRV